MFFPHKQFHKLELFQYLHNQQCQKYHHHYLLLFQKGQAEGKISSDYSQEDFLLILSIFNSGMKGLSMNLLIEKSEIVSRFFLNGWK